MEVIKKVAFQTNNSTESYMKARWPSSLKRLSVGYIYHFQLSQSVLIFFLLSCVATVPFEDNLSSTEPAKMVTSND